MGAYKKKPDVKQTEDENNPQKDAKWFSKDDVGEFAKLGGDVLKKTLQTGLDVLKEVKENLPKEAAQIITKKKDDLFKTISKESTNGLIELAVEKLFDVSKNYTLELSLRLKKIEETENKEKKTKNKS